MQRDVNSRKVRRAKNDVTTKNGGRKGLSRNQPSKQGKTDESWMIFVDLNGGRQ